MSGRYHWRESSMWLPFTDKVGMVRCNLDGRVEWHGGSDETKVANELNALLDRAEKAEAQIASDRQLLEAERAMTRDIARGADERIRKAEARVAELEGQVAAWSPARCYGPEDEDPYVLKQKPNESALDAVRRFFRFDVSPDAALCPVHGSAYASEEWGASDPPVLLATRCLKCGWAGKKPAKTAPETPAPAPEPTPSPAGHQPAAGTGPSRHDPPARGVAAGVEQAPVPGDSRASESSSLDMLGGAVDEAFKVYADMIRNPGTPDRRPTTCEDVKCPCLDLPVNGLTFGSRAVIEFGKVPAERPVFGSCRGCKGLTPDPLAHFCAMCCDLGRGTEKDREQLRFAAAKRYAEDHEDRVHQPTPDPARQGGLDRWVDARPLDLSHLDSQEPAPRPTRPPAGITEVWARDGKFFGKYAGGPEVELQVQQPDTGLVRVLVDPAQAAEVEARTGEWAGLTRLFWAGSEGLSEDAIRATLAVQRPPRAGLPSRDEVVAFLDGLKPSEPQARPWERPCVRCRRALPPERTWYHAECMDPRASR